MTDESEVKAAMQGASADQTIVIQAITVHLSAGDLAELAAEEKRWRAQGRPLIGQVDKALGRVAGRSAKRAVPQMWTVVHVLDRLEEAFEILGRVQMNTKPKGFGNAMPAYTYDRFDLNAQLETGELDRLMRSQNHVRLGADAGQIQRMEEALAWPLRYLRDKPEVARAVQITAYWSARRVDIRRRCKQLRINRKWLLRRKMHGLEIIAIELIRAKVRVT